MSREYTSVDEIENYLTLNIDENFESQVEKWIEAMSNYVALISGREWSVTQTTKNYSGNNTNNIPIDDATAITKVTINEEDVTDKVTVYPFNELPIRRLIIEDSIFPYKVKNIAVEGSFGANTTIPEDIRFITTVLVAGIILAQTQQEGEVQSERVGNYQVTYSSDSQKGDYEMAKQMLNVRKKMVI